MLRMELTDYGIRKVNESIIDSSKYLDVSKIKGNNYLSEFTVAEMRKMEDLPYPILHGQVISMNYDHNNKAIGIQAIIEPGQGFAEINAIGFFDSHNKMIGFIIHRSFIKYDNQLLRYFTWFPILSQDGAAFNTDNIRIILPKNQVVHQTYTFKDGNTWIIRHYLQTPLVNFTLYDRLNQYIPDSDYEAFANPGKLIIHFKNGVEKAGYCSIIAEGFTFSHTGEQLTELDPNKVNYMLTKPGTWIGSMLIED